MDNLQKTRTGEHDVNQQYQECITNEKDTWPANYPFSVKNLPEYRRRQNETVKDCLYKPDNINVNTVMEGSTRGSGDYGHNKEEVPPGYQEKEVTVEHLMESVDLSDLTFSCNDFIPGDCTCFEQASQLVDPTIKDSESTPFSFNNSDSVQLFRFSLPESTEDNLTCLNKYTDSLFIKDKCDKNDAVKNDHYNFYRVFELLDNNMNIDAKKDELEHKSEDKTSGMGAPPIKKGRRYLPNFKEKVLEYAKNHTFKETALHFKINCNTLTDWSGGSKRLSMKRKKTKMPGTDYKNYKTDIVGTPESKTEIIIVNDSFETELGEPSPRDIEEEVASLAETQPDERFMYWVEARRMGKKQISRMEVFHVARCCLKKAPGEPPSWFVLWVKRFNKALKNSAKTTVETEKYIKYPNKFKLEVALYARRFTKNSAARVFNVPRRRMFDWFNRLNPLKDSFLSSAKSEAKDEKKVSFKATKDKYKNKIYTELHLWYQKRFTNGIRPTSYEIKEKGREIFSSHGITDVKFSDGWLQKFCQRSNIKLRHSEDDRLLLWVLTQFDNNVTLSHQEITEKSSSLIGKKKFKGSKGWTLRFLKRHKNLLQRCPTLKDQLPQIVDENLTNFWNNFRQSLTSMRLGPESVGCMDEIPISFNYPEEGKSSNIPLLRKTGFENCQGVIILSALGSGRLLPPAVVFKGTGPKQLLSERNLDILILYQEKGLVTVDILMDWFVDIWLTCAPSPSILVLDSFHPHCAPELKQLTTRHNCAMHVIPEGCSSRFQPLDVEVTPSFKESMKKQWKEFSSEVSRGGGVGGVACCIGGGVRYRYPDQDKILDWVKEAYMGARGGRSAVSITDSFRSTGLLLAEL